MPPVLRGLMVLLACQCAGEILSSSSHFPLPGPVFGLLLLLAVLVWRGGVPNSVLQASNALLGSLGLLYVPAGVGIITQLGLLRQNWIAVSVALLVSIPLGLAVAALAMQHLDRAAMPDQPQSDPPA